MIRLYVIPVEAHDLVGVKVGAICWGECGKGLVGGIGLGRGDGSAIPCAEEVCPYLDRQMSEPMGTVEWNGREYAMVLRKIHGTRNQVES
jgi:hypothetical protein